MSDLPGSFPVSVRASEDKTRWKDSTRVGLYGQSTCWKDSCWFV